MINSSFDLNQKISFSLSLILIILMSFATAWFSLSAGEKAADYFSQSTIYNPDGSGME